MIYGTLNQLRRNEESLQRFNVTFLLLESLGHIERVAGVDHLVIFPPFGTAKRIVVSYKCLNLLLDIHCHWLFPQYRINGAQQSVCREQCEELYHDVCKNEYNLLQNFNDNRGSYPYYWSLVECATLPWQNASRGRQAERTTTTCYSHDNERGEKTREKTTGTERSRADRQTDRQTDRENQRDREVRQTDRQTEKISGTER